MQLHFVGKNIEVTQALKDFTTEKFVALESRFHPITHVNVIFVIEHIQHIAEANLFFNGFEINAKAEAEDMYVAIDEMMHKISAQIIKHKEKLIDSHR